MPEYDTVAIVGVGLIGGSIGLALRERNLAREVVGVGRAAASLDTAQRIGAIHRGTVNATDGLANAQLIVVATPVDSVADNIGQIATAAPRDAVITDAGSTKSAIVAAADVVLAARPGGPYFVGSHPIAGDHRTGPQHARADLFEGRTVVVTPTPASDPNAVEKITSFWDRLGAKIVTMSAEEHDASLAATSHLPHLVSAALAAATPLELLPLTAGGWRDTTRVAGGDPQLWRPIFATNRPQVLAALERFERCLARLRTALSNNDDILFEQLLLEAKRTRDALGD